VTWRRAGSDDFPLAWLWATAAALALLMSAWLPLLAPLAPHCALHQLTGIPCLGCGTTRAALALARADLGAALAANPLAAIGLLGGVFGGLLAPAWVAARGPLPRLPRPLPLSWRMGMGGVLAADWAYLVLRGA
jgi:hypothetical protein